METHQIEPLREPFDLSLDMPGSKSHTNRALVCAALASGTSQLSRLLLADDTVAMIEVWKGLGVEIEVAGNQARVVGIGGLPNLAKRTKVFANRSGTTARFMLPVLAFSEGEFELDGDKQLRGRPFDQQIEALDHLGAQIEGARLPLQISGSAPTASSVSLPGDVSSQYLSGLLLVAPMLPNGLSAHLTTELVSVPYVTLTVDTMRRFGAAVEVAERGISFNVGPEPYCSANLELEPDASAASYFFAAAAITGSSVTIPGLGSDSIQGDLRFVEILEQMGAEVSVGEDQTVVKGTGVLQGVTVDMSDCSDVAQTLAVVAAHAEGPTEISGIGFIRHKETDRVAATVAELNRCGIRAEETADGMIIHPGKPAPAVIQTYDDHRMAMSFALLGLKHNGIEIADPTCVEKTFRDFWSKFQLLY